MKKIKELTTENCSKFFEYWPNWTDSFEIVAIEFIQLERREIAQVYFKVMHKPVIDELFKRCKKHKVVCWMSPTLKDDRCYIIANIRFLDPK